MSDTSVVNADRRKVTWNCLACAMIFFIPLAVIASESSELNTCESPFRRWLRYRPTIFRCTLLYFSFASCFILTSSSCVKYQHSWNKMWSWNTSTYAWSDHRVCMKWPQSVHEVTTECAWSDHRTENTSRSLWKWTWPNRCLPDISSLSKQRVDKWNMVLEIGWKELDKTDVFRNKPSRVEIFQTSIPNRYSPEKKKKRSIDIAVLRTRCAIKEWCWLVGCGLF